MPKSPGPRVSSIVAWAFYDWANSAFPTVIVTFVFAAYFTTRIADDPVSGTASWGAAISLSALAVAIAGPVLGAIADHGGRRKPWIGAFTAIAVIASALLWYARPQPSDAVWALTIVAAGNFAFEMGMVFYNAMLPGLAPKGKIGRISGWGWGLGYAGGLACLGVALLALLRPDGAWLGLNAETLEHVRAVGPLVALWFAVFSLPLFFLTPDTPSTGVGVMDAVRRGLASLAKTVRDVRRHAGIARYLLARMIYIDGLNTLFAFGGVYAAGTFGMDFDELILFGIALNVTAGLGAAGFAWVDDRIGPKRTILISIAGLTVLGGILLVVPTKTLFWVCAIPLGLFVGPAQAASRSMMAHMAPDHLRTEMFGLYALSGKATAFLGPALLGWVTVAAGSQRVGMATVLAFFIVGGALLVTVPDVRR